MHDNIEKYSLDGIVADNNIVSAKETLIRSLESQMRDEGYAPVLDIDPQFTLDYRSEDGSYNFCLTIYGIYCQDAWNVAGVMSGKIIWKNGAKKSIGPNS